MAELRSALSGLTVVDLSTGLAAALASMFLADNGARVVRLVSEDDEVVREPGIFALYDRGKEVARVDPNAGSETLLKICANADVMLDDLPPSSEERTRLGLDALTTARPGIVHCSITAYGPHGPLKDESPDHDLVAARTGILASQPSYRGGPIHVVHPVAYVGAGLLAAIGIVAALCQRERTGLGRRVETSLMSGALLYTPKVVGEQLPVHPMSSSPQGGGPFYSVFECSDGRWIQLGCIHSGFVDLAAAVIGVADLIASTPEFGDGRWPGNEEARQRLFDHVAAAIKTRRADDWIRDLQAADVPCGLSAAAELAMSDPQILHNGLVQQLDDPLLGATRMAGPPIRLSATPGRVRGPRPAAGRESQVSAAGDAADVGDPVQPHPLEAIRADSNPPPSRETRSEADPGLADELPLTDVRIMEMTNVIAGPVAGRLLADLGAEMIKFESLDGDISRPAGGAGFIAFNTNKRSVSANTRTDDGKEVARRLAASSDAILANMRPGASARMGLDDETLSRVNPGLIQSHITAYGWDGPYARRPGVDPIAQAMSGLQRAQGGYDGPPVYLSSLAPCDYTGGALGALGTVLALLARARLGVSQKVDTDLLAAGTIMNVDGFLEYSGKRPRCLPDRDQFGLGPLRRLYRVSDGWVYLAADAPEAQRRLAVALDELKCETVDSVFSNTTVETVLRSLRSHGVPCAPVVEGYGARFFSDPQAEKNGMVAELQHPALGAVKLSGNLVSFDGLDTLPRRPTPLLGQHTAEVLADLGYTPEQISRLYREGVVKTEPPA